MPYSALKEGAEKTQRTPDELALLGPVCGKVCGAHFGPFPLQVELKPGLEREGFCGAFDALSGTAKDC